MARGYVAGSMVALVATLVVVTGLRPLRPVEEPESTAAVPVVVASTMEVAGSGGPSPEIAAIETAPFGEVAVRAPVVAAAVKASVPDHPREETPSATETVYLSGVVIATEGEPVAEAMVRLMRLRDDGKGVRHRAAGGRAKVKAGADGTFAFTKAPLDPRYEHVVIAASPHFYQRDVGRVGPGAHGVEIELVRGATLSGKVIGWRGPMHVLKRFSPTIHGRFAVTVRGLSGAVNWHGEAYSPTQPITRFATVEADGTFSMHGLPPGSATVSVEARALVPPLVTYEGVVVPAGRSVVDSRLLQIDLRAVTRWATITVRDPRGAPRSCVLVRVFVADGSRMAFAGTTGPDGRWAFPVGDPVRVGVGSQKTAWVSLEGVDGDRDVVLGAGIDLTVRFVGAEVPTTGSPWILASLQYLGPADAPERWRGLALGRQCVDVSGPLRFRAPGAGRYRVDLSAAWGKRPFG